MNQANGVFILKLTNTGAYTAHKWYGVYLTSCGCNPYSGQAGTFSSPVLNPVNGMIQGIGVYGYPNNSSQEYYYNTMKAINKSTLAISSLWGRKFDTYIQGYNNGGINKIFFDSSDNMVGTGDYSYSFVNYDISYCPLGAQAPLVMKFSNQGTTITWCKSLRRDTGARQYRQSNTTSSAISLDKTKLVTYRYGSGTYGDTSNYYHDITKFNTSDGSVDSWYRATLYMSGSNFKISTTDSSGNIYITGTYNQSGYNKIYTAKYNSSMVVQWVKTMYIEGSSGYGNTSVVDSSGNVYTIGTLYCYLGAVDGFGQVGVIIKYDSSGNVIWIRYMKSDAGSIRYVTGYSLKLDSADQLIATFGWQIQNGIQRAIVARLKNDGSGTGSYTLGGGYTLQYMSTIPTAGGPSSAYYATVYNSTATSPSFSSYTPSADYEYITVGSTTPTGYQWNTSTATGYGLVNYALDTSSSMTESQNMTKQIL